MKNCILFCLFLFCLSSSLLAQVDEDTILQSEDGSQTLNYESLAEDKELDQWNLSDSSSASLAGLLPVKITMRQRMESDLQQRAGFENGNYAGSAVKNLSRFMVAAGNRFTAGLILEKDAGESNMTDYWNGYVQFHQPIQTQWLTLNQVILGSYRYEFGQGLLFWGPYGFGKSAISSGGMYRQAKGGRPFLSSEENRYLSGIFTGMSVPPLSSRIDIFYSNHTYDGYGETVADLNGFDFNPITEYHYSFSGYHRTATESLRKDQIEARTMGASLSIDPTRQSHIGFIVSTIHQSTRRMEAEKITMRSNVTDDYLTKANLTYVGMDWNWSLFNMDFFGETQFRDNQKALVAGAQLTPNRGMGYLVQFRTFDRYFGHLFANPLRESGASGVGERGLLQWVSLKFDKFEVRGMIDFYLLTNGLQALNEDAAGSEFAVSLKYRPSGYQTMLTQLSVDRVEDTHLDQDDLGRDVVKKHMVTKWSLQWMYKAQVDDYLNLTAKSDIKHVTSFDDPHAWGFAVTLMSRIDVTENFRVNFQGTYFDSQSGDTRLYAYEYHVPGAFSINQLSGQGIRAAIVIGWQPLQWMTLSGKLNHLVRYDQDEISSGDQAIASNQINQVAIQVDFTY